MLVESVTLRVDQRVGAGHSKQIKITDFTSEALGVGRLESGQVAMLRGAVPGDTIAPKLDNSKRKGIAFGEIEQIIEPSEHRTEHKCPHYREGCSGCLLGVYDYAAELRWKTDHLRQTLRRIGKIAEPDVREIIKSPMQWNYRDRLELHLELKDGIFNVGYITQNGFIPVSDCNLGAKSIRDSIVSIKKILPTLSFKISDHSFRLLIRDNGNGKSVAIIFTDTKSTENLEALQNMIAHGNFAGWEIRYVADYDLRFFFARTLDKAGGTRIRVDIGEKTISLPLDSFTQTNRFNSSVLRKAVIDMVPKGASLLDMYGGYGAFALEYAYQNENGQALVIESSKTMLTAGKQFAKRENLAVRFSRINLRKLSKLDYPTGKYSCAVLDPPRSGLHGRVIQYLNDQGPELLIYVSCKVAALARDLQKLTSYDPEYFQPIDMFPNTPEIETVSLLRRNVK